MTKYQRRTTPEWRAKTEAAAAAMHRRTTMTKTDQAKIREEYEAKSNAIIQRLERVAGDNAARFPAPYVTKEREAAMAELRTLEGRYRDRAEAARASAYTAAQQVRLNPESEDQAATADLLEADMLHRRYPDKASARNHLEGEVRALLAAGNARAASVRLSAMKLSGAPATQLEHAVENALDEQLPHRREAREIEAATDQEYVAHRVTELAARRRANQLIGNQRAAAVASASEKLVQWAADPDGYAGTAALTGGDA